MKKIVIFASGAGTNALNIVSYFERSQKAYISLILSNNPQAGVLEKSSALQIPTLVFNRKTFYNTEIILNVLRQIQPDMIVLAGFLWKFPPYLTEAFNGKVINIHPSLLPKYGGKGMYGEHVHKAVIENKEPQSGITIHYVNEAYDQGNIIFQKSIAVEENDTCDVLATKIHQLEYKYFPMVIEKLLFDEID